MPTRWRSTKGSQALVHSHICNIATTRPCSSRSSRDWALIALFGYLSKMPIYPTFRVPEVRCVKERRGCSARRPRSVGLEFECAQRRVSPRLLRHHFPLTYHILHTTPGSRSSRSHNPGILSCAMQHGSCSCIFSLMLEDSRTRLPCFPTAGRGLWLQILLALYMHK